MYKMAAHPFKWYDATCHEAISNINFADTCFQGFLKRLYQLSGRVTRFEANVNFILYELLFPSHGFLIRYALCGLWL